MKFNQRKKHLKFPLLHGWTSEFRIKALILQESKSMNGKKKERLHWKMSKKENKGGPDGHFSCDFFQCFLTLPLDFRGTLAKEEWYVVKSKEVLIQYVT